MSDSLAALAAADLLRQPVVVDSAVGPRVLLAGREVVCLCSNDYLSLAADPAVRDAASRAVETWGVGAGASRLVSGTSRLHTELEEALADFKGTPAAIVTTTGWMANHAAVAALVGKGDLVLCDKLDHASILDAAKASGAGLRTYGHRDVHRLDKMLDRYRHRHRRCLVVTDSLFSMDGDVAPLGEIVELKNRYDALLMVDEAHATGVFGPAGRGVAEMLGVEEHVDASVGTLSKAIGGLGGFVAGRRELIDTIVNTARAYIYTTALPPVMCAAAREALRIIQTQPQRRTRLLEMAEDLRRRLHTVGFDTGESSSQIIPILIGSAGEAMRLSRKLLEAGYLVPAIRPPTVPRGGSRLRVSLCSSHNQGDLERFVGALTVAATT
jgi:8-amino-7-oxononanoate synthase